MGTEQYSSGSEDKFTERALGAKEKILSRDELKEKKIDTIPYVFKLEGEGKVILGYGADHLDDINDPMFADIEARFKEVNPDIVFVEGFTYPLEDTRESLRKYFKDTPLDVVVRTHGESGFVLRLALQHNCAAIVSPEPRRKEEIQELLNRRFSQEDIFAYYFFRVLAQYNRSQQKQSFVDYIKPYLDDFRESSAWGGFEYSIGHAEQIGERLWGTKLIIGDPDYYRERVGPLLTDEDEGYSSVNKISEFSGRYRDENILIESARALDCHSRLFIVYGSSHMIQLEPAFGYLLGDDPSFN